MSNRENLGSVLGFKPPKMSNLTPNFTLILQKVLVLEQLLELELETQSLLRNPGVGKTQIFIKPKQIYFRNHGLALNDEISYETNGGTSLQVWNGLVGSPYQSLTDFSELYVYKFDDNFIGISSNKIGIGSTGAVVGVNTTISLLSFTNVGTGDTHSFTTNFINNLRVKVDSNVVTVSTAVTHSLQVSDRIDIEVKPKTVIDVDVIYNEYNRRIVFDPRTFSSGDVDVNENSINFSSRYFETGDRVIYIETSPIGGLVDQEMYYVLIYERNKIRLVNELYQIKTEECVNITSTGSGITLQNQSKCCSKQK